MPVILITGSSTGIGCATAEALARAGHTVYATMRSPERSPYLQKLGEDENLSLIVLPMDVTDDESVQVAFNYVFDKEGYIDVLINNAGVASHGAVEELSMELFRNNMETNYFGTIRCIKAVLPYMRERRSGSIINVTSVAGKFYTNFHSAYCSSKAAVEALSESLAQEVKPFNIGVFVVEPGVIETPIFTKGNEVPANTHYQNIKRFFAFFAASLENHVQPSAVADVIKEIVEGMRTTFRNPAGPDAVPLLSRRALTSDEDWVNATAIDDETWISRMEELGLNVRKYMQPQPLQSW